MPKSVLESEIEKATNECNVSEDWQSYMDICDQIKANPNGPKEALKSIMKRCSNPVPHVAMQALTLLATCVNNCGKPFHLEICSREWTNDAKNLIAKSHEKVSLKLRELIKKWAEDFKNDPQLNLMCQFQKKLKADGLLSDSVEKPSKMPSLSNELNFKEDLDLAIAMSLQESNGSKQTSRLTNLYPTMSQVPISNQETKEVCRVLALYDFEAAEDNEMTFKAGEIFSVLDNSDQNWWKGCNQRGVGLFPANFVTTDLSGPQKEQVEKKKVRFVEESSVQEVKPESKEATKGRSQNNIISQEHLDLTLSMLKNASPNELDEEEETISAMEMRSKEMGYAIEKKIIECQRKKDDLNDLNSKFLQAISIYQQLMKEPMVAQSSYQMQQSYSEAPYQQFAAPQMYASSSNKVFSTHLKSDNFSSQSEVERQQQALYTQQQRQQQQLIQQHYQERTLSNVPQQYQALPQVYDASQISYVQTPTVYYDAINYQQPSNGYTTYDSSYPVTSYNQTPVYH